MARNELLLAIPAGDGGPEFPVDQVEQYLASQRFRLRDEQSGATYLCGSPAGTQFARVRIFSEPDEPMPPVVIIRVAPTQIQIWQRADQDALLQARAFAEWLLASFPCQIRTTSGEDISRALDEEYA